MKATPIAQYLDRKDRVGAIEWPSSRREPSPFKPRPKLAAPDEPTPNAPVFRRSGLLAAVATRTDDPEASASPPSGEAAPPRRDSVFFRPREAAPVIDIEARLAEAYHRGVQEGLDTAKAEAATARALERAEMQKRAVVERLDFQMNEYAALSETIANGLIEIEGRIADVVARILQPFVTEAVCSQIVDELAENVASLRRAGRPELLKITGPERLLSALKRRLEPLAADVEFVEREGVEVSVEAGPTTIRSELAPWADLIASIIERD